MSDPTALPTPSDSPQPTWLLGPADIAAVAADPVLLQRLVAGERPVEDGPVSARLVAWLAEVAR